MKCVGGLVCLYPPVLRKMKITIIMAAQKKDFVFVAIVAILTTYFIKLTKA